MKKSIISQMAKNCEWHKTVNENWMHVCESRIEKLQNLLPSGSGLDAGCNIDVENSDNKKIVINFSFHHLNDEGFYDGWTSHKLTCVSEFNGFDMKISGRDKNQIKEYLYDLFFDALTEEVEEVI